MKPTFTLCTLFICISTKGFGQENNRGGIVYGPKAAFNIGAPKVGFSITRLASSKDCPAFSIPKANLGPMRER